MGRGGYEISPDDREDGDNITDSDDDDDDDVDTESTRLGRRAVGRSESESSRLTGRDGARAGWVGALADSRYPGDPSSLGQGWGW